MTAMIDKIVTRAGDRLFLVRSRVERSRVASAARGFTDQEARSQMVSDVGDQLYLLRDRIERADVAEKIAASPVAGVWQSLTWSNIRAAMLRRSGWIGAASCTTIAVSLASLSRLMTVTPDPSEGQAWYYDLTTR